MESTDEMVFESGENLELILAYSLLSKTRVRVAVKKRYEMLKSFIKLLQSISHGSSYLKDGEYVRFVPGSLCGGEVIFRCCDEISVYISSLLVLCPFVTEPLRIRFKGITNGRLCVDMIRIAHFNVLKRFGIDSCDLVVKKRGFEPRGGGEVLFTVSGPRKIATVDLGSEEKILKTRGLVLSSRVSSIPTKEMTDRIKELMGDMSNTKVFSNMSNKLDSGPSPGFQCVVFAESKNGVYYSITNGKDLTPKEAATMACKGLLKSIRYGGVFDKQLVYLAFSLMSLSSTNIGRLCIGKVDSEAQSVLDLLRLFFKFEYEVRKSEGGYVIYGPGCGLTNVNRLLR